MKNQKTQTNNPARKPGCLQRFVRGLIVRLLRWLPISEASAAYKEAVLLELGFRRSEFPGCWHVPDSCAERYGLEGRTSYREWIILKKVGMRLPSNVELRDGGTKTENKD